MVFRGLLVVLLVSSLSGCGLLSRLFKREKGAEKGAPATEGKAEEAPVRAVGEIASIHPEEGFVLIHRFAQGSFGTAGLLSSLGPDGATCSLRLTGEQLGRYYAADIQEGTPKKGDLVMARDLPKASVAPSTPLPETPASGENAPWMKNFSNP